MLSVMAQSGLVRDIKSGQITSIEREKKQISMVQVTCNLSPEAVRMFSQARHLHSIGSRIEPEETNFGAETQQEEASESKEDNNVDE